MPGGWEELPPTVPEEAPPPSPGSVPEQLPPEPTPPQPDPPPPTPPTDPETRLVDSAAGEIPRRPGINDEDMTDPGDIYLRGQGSSMKEKARDQGVSWGCALVGLICIAAFGGPVANALAKSTYNPSPPPAAQAQASIVDPAPKLSLPDPQPPPPPADAPPVADPVPADPGSGAINSGGDGSQPVGNPPSACTPTAPSNITTSAGHATGGSNGNGGSWTITNPGATVVTITDSGMKACNGLHHSMHVRGENSDGYTSQCNPSTGATVSVTISTSDIKAGSTKPFGLISVDVTYDSGC
ncbi:MAG TPA: hypothetical protein VG329_08895 [Candidatus Dormibacteraeota bacterium]|nr:hypothetical protein [Candidatus Dormibacteraeota bacterium]